MLQNKQKQVKKSIGFYPDILQRIDEEAERQRRSRSNMLDVIVRKYFKLEVEEKMTPQRPLAR
jgi:metal-responsive CopG/Arc/MetJ family transcriptional regulator